MKILLALSFLVATPAFAGAQPLNEGRCFDIKQSVLADLPHFCGSARTDKTRLQDFRHQIALLEKSCAQPQLAQLLRRALEERVAKGSARGCTVAAEKAVLPTKALARAASDEL
jgi:hypothetical protein